ncbi:unnamed protein product [Ilex paraguariensis]|uniref:Uncharacterized protein n=1 Tax=Ilex paraguariensis TaxID=185542 RepID=A0ABC8V0N9_9AQUA
MADLRFKLTRIVSRHEQLKIAFNQLNSQIKIGLLEAEDVFASLAVPLMKLVDFKDVEMAKEGRFSTIFMDTTDLLSQGHQRNDFRSATPVRSASAVGGMDQNYKINTLAEEIYTARASTVCDELIQRQKLQLTLLVHLLKQIETQVNRSQDDIFQTLTDHRASIQKFFKKAVTYVSAILQSNQNNGIFFLMLKLLKTTFDHVGSALSSVECDVEDMMQKLAENMCIPMVEYVKGLKTEMTSGTCPQLLAIVEEMGGAMREGRVELEEVRNKVRIAEERKLEALSRLKESEERVGKMNEQLGFFLEAKRGSNEHCLKHKLLGMEEDQPKDDKLLWELLKKKRKYQIPGSPVGPKELLGIGTNKKHLISARERQSTNCRPITKSYLRRLSPQTPCLDPWLALGSSPSAPTHQVLSRKRITP